MGALFDRRDYTRQRIDALRGELKDADRISNGKACVYATGSFGRGEGGRHSDLDIFIVGRRNGKPGPDGKEGSELNQLDEICLKADLIEVTRRLKFPPFSADGRYLVHHSAHELTKTLGAPEDDVTNTFTARLLLLLESRPLIGKDVYEAVTNDVVAAYWRDYEDHKSDFMPAFLSNDILRLWRTLCVNYEARTDRDPIDKKAKGKIKNYKLKHSRILTCYSAILYMLTIYKQSGTVSPKDALTMIGLTPTQRLEWLSEQPNIQARRIIDALLTQYDEFLVATDRDEESLIELFMNKKECHELMSAANKFGNLVFEALSTIGENSPFHRMLVV